HEPGACVDAVAQQFVERMVLKRIRKAFLSDLSAPEHRLVRPPALKRTRSYFVGARLWPRTRACFLAIAGDERLHALTLGIREHVRVSPELLKPRVVAGPVFVLEPARRKHVDVARYVAGLDHILDEKPQQGLGLDA